MVWLYCPICIFACAFFVWQWHTHCTVLSNMMHLCTYLFVLHYHTHLLLAGMGLCWRLAQHRWRKLCSIHKHRGKMSLAPLTWSHVVIVCFLVILGVARRHTGHICVIYDHQDPVVVIILGMARRQKHTGQMCLWSSWSLSEPVWHISKALGW